MVFGPGNGYRLRTIKAHYTVNAPFSEDYPEDAYSIILCWGPCCPWTLGGCNRSEAVVAGSENWTTSRPVVPDNLDDSSCGLVSYNPNGGRVTANVSQHVCLSPCFMCSKKKSQSKEWSLVKVQGQTHHFKPPWKKRILPVSEISFLNLNHIQTPTASLVHTLEQQTVNKTINKNIM